MSIIDTLLATVGPHNTVLHAHSLKEPRFIQKALHDPNEDACKIKSKRVDHTFKMVNNKPRHNRVYRTVRKPTETTNFSDKQTSIRPRMFIGYTDADKYKWTLMASEQQLAEVPPEQYFGCRFTPTHISRKDHIGFIFSFDENLVYSANYIDTFGNYYVSTSIHPIRFGSEEYKIVFGELSKRDIFVNKSKYTPVQKDKIIPTNQTGDEIRKMERNKEISQFLHYIRTNNLPPVTPGNPEQEFLPEGENSLGDDTITPDDNVRLHRKDFWDEPGNTYREPDYNQNPDAMEEEYSPEKTEDTNKTSIEDKPSIQQITDVTNMENVDNRVFINFTIKELDIKNMGSLETTNPDCVNVSDEVMSLSKFKNLSEEEQYKTVWNYIYTPWGYINNIFHLFLERTRGTLHGNKESIGESKEIFKTACQNFEGMLNETIQQRDGMVGFFEDGNLLYDIYYKAFGNILETIGEHTRTRSKQTTAIYVIKNNIINYINKIKDHVNIVFPPNK